MPFFSTVSLIASNCTGKTKRSVVSTICFIAYTTGNIGKLAKVLQSKGKLTYT